jgi:hypothetical protein
MMLQKITTGNVNRLNWFDKVYIIVQTKDQLNESLKILEILPFYEVESKLDLTYGNYYYSNAVKYF